MALVLKPPQRRLLPVGKLKIDLSHPLANGLVACYLPGVAAGINLVGNGGDLGFDTAATIDSGVEGPGLSSTAVNSGMFGTASAPQKTGNTFSVYWRGYMLGNAVAFCDFISTTFDNATGSPFNGYGVGSGTGGSTANMRLVWSTGAAGNALNIGTFSTTGVQSIGGSFTTGGNAVGYLNGVNSASTTFGASPPSTSATTQVCLNTYQSVQTRFANAVAFIGCIWNRALSDAEHAAIDSDPYCFLIPAEGEMPALFLPATTTTTGGARIRQRWNRSPLAYPAGAVPGIDPAHPASRGLRGSVVPVWGGNARNLGGTAEFAKAGSSISVVSSIDQYLGQSITTAGAGSLVQFNAPQLPTTPVGAGYTFACIVKPLNVSATEVFISNSDPEGEGIYQGVIAGNFALRIPSTLSFDSGVAASNGVPYFYAASVVYKGSSTWDHNHVILRLDTGQLTAVSVTGTTGSAALTYVSTIFRVSGSTGFGAAVNIGPAMTSTSFLSLPQLLGWAKSPWEFWYPNKTINLASSAASVGGGGFLAAWALGSNLPVIGTGNY